MITLNEFKKNNPKKCRLIGLDLGSKRIGVAICDENWSIATPFKTIQKTTNESLIKDLKDIILENNIEGIIVGNPINMDGSPSASSQSAKDLALNLSKDVTQNITMWDERLSSEGAFNLSSNLDINVSKKVQKLDENAAQFILQGALDYLNKNNT